METAASLPQADPDVGPVRRWTERIRYALGAAVLAFLLDGVLLAIAPDAIRTSGAFERGPDVAEGIWLILYAVFGAPVVETALMVLLLRWLTRLLPPWIAAVLCALFMTACHWIDGGINWVVAPSFVLFAFVYLARAKPPRSDGFAVTALAHGFSNVLSFAMVFYWHFR